MKQDETNQLQEIPEDRPKKIPRVLPTSREEYESRRRYIPREPIEYFPSTFNVDLDEEEKQESPTSPPPTPPAKEEVQADNPVTFFDFLTMIPVFLTTASFLWHLTFEEVHPLMHNIIDSLLIFYHMIWAIYFSVKEKLSDAQAVLMVFCAILGDALLGFYGDMSHSYLQCMFSVPFAILLWFVFVFMASDETKRGAFASTLGKCLWLGSVLFLLWRGVHHFRWVGFCQLIGILLTAVFPLLTDSKVTKTDYVFMVLSGLTMIAVIFGFGA